jgi:hypothetical protein
MFEHRLRAMHASMPGLAASILCVFAVGARAATSATISAAIEPNQLGAHAALAIRIHYSGGAAGVPSPVRRSVLRLPAGFTLDIPRLRGCPLTRLRDVGAAACPPQSRIGGGWALMEAHLGSQTIREEVGMRAFLGFPQGGNPTFEILACGNTPIDECEVLTGVALSSRPPYGERLLISIPPIPTLPLEPHASIIDFTLRIGHDGASGARENNSVLVPSSCPASGFPFAAEFTYANGTQSVAASTVVCPL